MKRIAVFCVSYKSYSQLYQFADSVAKAASQAGRDKVEVHLFVADNTTEGRQPVHIQSDILRTKIYCYDNPGYFGAVGMMMQTEDVAKFDYVCISNVDVQVHADAFSELESIDLPEDTGWVAPSIYSKMERRDRNPSVIKRYSLLKLRLLRLMFKYPLLHKLQYSTIYKRKKYRPCYDAMPIYAGHGSFIILTREYIKRCGIINYPIFLYGEELYLGEMCKAQGLKVMYEPSVKIADDEHFSTSKLGSAFTDKCNKEALEYIIRTFY